jgi:5-formyltetrahydrofolate cyclo-ligase
MTDKRAMRVAAKATLASLDPERCQKASAMAAKTVRAIKEYAEAQLVLAFLSMPGEIDTGAMIVATMADKKRVAVPRIEKADIAFIELETGWQSWPRDRWGIPVPPTTATVLSPAAIAQTPVIALVPGLAFDQSGGRLGRGKGYYDRFLASVSAARLRLGAAASPFLALGYGFTEQLVDRVPMEPHDFILDELALG